MFRIEKLLCPKSSVRQSVKSIQQIGTCSWCYQNSQRRFCVTKRYDNLFDVVGCSNAFGDLTPSPTIGGFARRWVQCRKGRGTEVQYSLISSTPFVYFDAQKVKRFVNRTVGTCSRAGGPGVRICLHKIWVWQDELGGNWPEDSMLEAWKPGTSNF
jgi:hypothetical protein